MATSNLPLLYKRRPFRLEIGGSAEEKSTLLEQLSLIKERIRPGCKTTTLEALQYIFRQWLKDHEPTSVDPSLVASNKEKEQYESQPTQFHILDTDKAEKETLHIVSASALRQLEQTFNNHSVKCKGRLNLDTDNVKACGYWNRFMLQCSEKVCEVFGFAKFKWATSAYLNQTESYVNQRILHAAQCSGLLALQLDVFTKTVNIKSSATKILRPSDKSCSQYIDSVIQAAKCSASNWLRKESKENTAPIDILTDARHGWRKNARQTDVICIGNDTKKVVAYKVVTSDDDPIAQRHELIGTKDIYNQMDLNNVLVGKHAHDNNSSITKYVRVSRMSTINQLDNWHALKQLGKTIKLIGAGTKKTKYVSWHPQLEDKAHAITCTVRHE